MSRLAQAALEPDTVAVGDRGAGVSGDEAFVPHPPGHIATRDAAVIAAVGEGRHAAPTARDTSWPGLQADEGDSVTFYVTTSPAIQTGTIVGFSSWSGSAYDETDLRQTGGFGTAFTSSAGFNIFPFHVGARLRRTQVRKPVVRIIAADMPRGHCPVPGRCGRFHVIGPQPGLRSPGDGRYGFGARQSRLESAPCRPPPLLMPDIRCRNGTPRRPAERSSAASEGNRPGPEGGVGRRRGNGWGRIRSPCSDRYARRDRHARPPRNRAGRAPDPGTDPRLDDMRRTPGRSGMARGGVRML